MNEEQLNMVEAGLNLLIKKFKLNKNPGDLDRMKAATEAKAAIRKVILNAAIKGEIKDIAPVKVKGQGYGWEVVESNDRLVRYVA